MESSLAQLTLWRLYIRNCFGTTYKMWDMALGCPESNAINNRFVNFEHNVSSTLLISKAMNGQDTT